MLVTTYPGQWEVDSTHRSPSPWKVGFLFCLSFLSGHPGAGSPPTLLRPQQFVWASTFCWPAPGKCLACAVIFSFMLKSPGVPLTLVVGYSPSLDSSACERSQSSRVRLVGIRERGLFHILKDNIITWLRLR